MPAIEIHNLVKTYKNGTQALKGVDLAIEEGDFFGLLGANGAGKTTLIGILTSLVNKTSGTATVFGHDLDEDPDGVKQQIGVVPQEFNFSIFEKVQDIVVTQAGYFGVPRQQAKDETERLLKALELWNKRDAVSRSLSGGMKRRLMIARALVHRPKFLILDEPTAGVDVKLRYGMWEYLRELNAQGTTILLTTHYLEEAEQLCKNVAIIKEGEIIRQGRVRDLLQSMEQKTYVVTVDRIPEDVRLADYQLASVDEHTLEVDLDAQQTLTDMMCALRESGMQVRDLRPKGNRLEQLFLNILRSS